MACRSQQRARTAESEALELQTEAAEKQSSLVEMAVEALEIEKALKETAQRQLAELQEQWNQERRELRKEQEDMRQHLEETKGKLEQQQMDIDAAEEQAQTLERVYSSRASSDELLMQQLTDAQEERRQEHELLLQEHEALLEQLADANALVEHQAKTLEVMETGNDDLLRTLLQEEQELRRQEQEQSRQERKVTQQQLDESKKSNVFLLEQHHKDITAVRSQLQSLEARANLCICACPDCHSLKEAHRPTCRDKLVHVHFQTPSLMHSLACPFASKVCVPMQWARMHAYVYRSSGSRSRRCPD